MNVTAECRWYKKDQGNFTHELTNDNGDEETDYWCSSFFFSISFSFFGILNLLLL